MKWTFPEWLTAERRWMLWALRDGRKTPLQISGNNASSTNPKTWSDYSTIQQTFSPRRHAGAAFALGDGFAGLDLDGCRNPDTGAIDSWASEYLRMFEGVTPLLVDISPSNTGLKLVFKTSRSFKGINRKLPQHPDRYGKPPGVELYCGGRFFCLTGVSP